MRFTYSARSLLIALFIAALSPSILADAFEDLDNDFFATGAQITKTLTDDWQLDLQALGVFDDFGDGLLSIGLSTEVSPGLRIGGEYVNRLLDSTDSRPDPWEHRLRTSIGYSKNLGEKWNLSTKLFTEYRKQDIGTGWRNRPSAVLTYGTSVMGHPTYVYTKLEGFYDHKADELSSTLLLLGASFPIAKNAYVDPGIYRIYTHSRNNTYNGLQVVFRIHFD